MLHWGSRLSSAGASLCGRKAGQKEKESARGAMGRGKREERLPPFPSSHRPLRAFYFPLLLFLLGYSAGACAEETGESRKNHNRGSDE